MPKAISTSRKLSPAACIAMRTSCGPSGLAAAGLGTSSSPSILPFVLMSRRHGPAGGARDSVRSSAARARRGAKTLPSRRAICGSSARARAAGRASAEASLASLSIRHKRPGCSDWAERTRPQAAARAGSGSSSPVAATAPRVRIARRASCSSSQASQACRRSSTAALAWRAAPARSVAWSGSSSKTSAWIGAGSPGSISCHSIPSTPVSRRGVAGAQGDRADPRQGLPACVKELDARGLPGGGEPHPQLPRPGAEEGGLAPGDGQALLLLGGQGDLCVYLLPRAPGGAEALEGGAVVKAGLGEAVIEELDLDRLCSGWRPLPERLGLLGRPGGEDALGVAGPLACLLLGPGLRAGVDRYLALAVLAGLCD